MTTQNPPLTAWNPAGPASGKVDAGEPIEPGTFPGDLDIAPYDTTK